jgi:hypothetical protein
VTQARICHRCGLGELFVELVDVGGSLICRDCMERGAAARRADVEEEAGCTGALWILGYPIGVLLLVPIEAVATVSARGCSRLRLGGECPGGITDSFIVGIRTLNGGPPGAIEWLITIALLVLGAWAGWRHLRSLTLAGTRLQRAVNRWSLGADPPRPEPGNGYQRIRVVTGRRRRSGGPIATLLAVAVWLVLASVGFLAPWLMAMLVLVVVP